MPRHGSDEQANVLTGRRVRKLRLRHGLSAKELATKAGVTQAYLSRLETGKLSPTIATLTRLLAAMDESVERLFSFEAVPATPHLARSDRRVVHNKGVVDEIVTAAHATRLRVLQTTVEPGAGSGPEDYTHAGDEECVLVLEGELWFWVSGTRYELREGDSLTFQCKELHRWQNEADAPCVLLWVTTPAGNPAIID